MQIEETNSGCTTIRLIVLYVCEFQHWENVRWFITSQAIKKKIQDLDSIEINNFNAKIARRLLQNLAIDDIFQLSHGVGLYYSWAKLTLDMYFFESYKKHLQAVEEANAKNAEDDRKSKGPTNSLEPPVAAIQWAVPADDKKHNSGKLGEAGLTGNSGKD